LRFFGEITDIPDETIADLDLHFGVVAGREPSSFRAIAEQPARRIAVQPAATASAATAQDRGTQGAADGCAAEL